MRVAVAGNPNVGKTSLFNVLTGERHRVGNYPGVTVERKAGPLAGKFGGAMTLIDLPGAYSLTAVSEDEAVAFGVLTGHLEAEPDAVLLVLDASNLARNLYLALQVLELGRPMVVALNMTDVAEDAGLPVDVDTLRRELGVPVVPTVARLGRGAAEVVEALRQVTTRSPKPLLIEPAPEMTALTEALSALEEVGPARARWLMATAAAKRLEQPGITEAERRLARSVGAASCWAATEQLVALRYRFVDDLIVRMGHADLVRDEAPAMSGSDRVDRVLTHPWLGTAAFVSIMALIFVSIFWWAEPFMDLIEGAIGLASEATARALGPGLLTDLVTEGVIAGVGNVLVFVPQIALLFLFIGLLEDSGYLSRAAFLLDRVMSRLGLHGHAFIPLLSGYACAIPAIMGTRTIASFKDRMVTILMIPYMSCSARLPIYALIIGALFVTRDPWVSPSVDRGLLLLSMYLLSTVSALVMGFIYKRTLLRSPTPPLVLELPPYRVPRMRNIGLQVYERTKDFVKHAGTVILAFTIILWAALSFPREDTGAGGQGPTQIEHSYGGKAAKVLEPALEPFGQNWRVGVGIIGSFAAREVLVSTLGLVYGMEADDEESPELRKALRNDRDPQTGEPVHTPLSGLALMVFFVYACMCMSTLAVVRRETRTWRWPVFMFFSMTIIAYVAAVAVYQVGRALGFG